MQMGYYRKDRLIDSIAKLCTKKLASPNTKTTRLQVYSGEIVDLKFGQTRKGALMYQS